MKEKDSAAQFLKLKEFVENWKIDKSVLAARINMSRSTFAKKWSDNLPAYNFTDEEKYSIFRVLNLISAEIKILYKKGIPQTPDILSSQKVKNYPGKSGGVGSLK